MSPMLSSMQVRHLIATRFSINERSYREKVDITEPDEFSKWFSLRANLMMALTARSIQSFPIRPEWLVYFSKGDEDMVSRHFKTNLFTPVFLGPEENVRRDLRSRVSNMSRGHLLLTRLDSDDALASGYQDFIIQSAIENLEYVPASFALVSPWGARVSLDHWQVAHQPKNQFVSVFIKQNARIGGGLEFFTPYEFQHVDVLNQPHISLSNGRASPMWLQTLHGRNVASNYYRDFSAGPILEGRPASSFLDRFCFGEEAFDAMESIRASIPNP